MGADDYKVVSAADAQKVIDSEPRFKEMRDALVSAGYFAGGSEQMSDFHAAAALARLLPLIVPAPQPGAVLVELSREEADIASVACSLAADSGEGDFEGPIARRAGDKLAAALHQQEGEKR